MTQLIFDFDGTLFSSSEGIYKSFIYACRKVGFDEPHQDVFATLIGPPIAHIVQELYSDSSFEDHLRFVSHFRQAYDESDYLLSYPYDTINSVLEFVNSIDGVPVPSIVTNKPTLPTKSLLCRHNMRHFFDKVVGIDYCASLHAGGQTFKSKQQSILYFKSVLNPSTQHCIYIGDTIADMNSALASTVILFRSDMVMEIGIIL